MKRKIKIESSISNIYLVENAVDAFTCDAGVTQECYGKILIATLEAVNNAILHGNKSDSGKKVEIEMTVLTNSLTIKITDEGNGFSPEEIPDPTKPENLQAINGRGVFLMSKLADKISFNTKGNSVEMTFKNILS
jgi:serine/threonine-protein kinase RsbW